MNSANDTAGFVGKAWGAVRRAYDVMVDASESVSDLYDALCLLRVVETDESILERVEWLYSHPENLPWNRRA